MFARYDQHGSYEEAFSVEMPVGCELGQEIAWFRDLFAGVYHVEGLSVYASACTTRETALPRAAE